MFAVGNDSDNLLAGLGGSDTLTGGGGIDTFAFAPHPGFAANANHLVTLLQVSVADLQLNTDHIVIA